jgi:predicted dehydrogenase
MSGPVRVGVAGCGAIAQLVHIPLLRARADVRITALADSDSAVLSQSVVQLRGVRAHSSLEAMLEEGELDAVVVTLPTALHAGAACAVLDAGLHLFLEKPLATTPADAADVLASWRRAGTVGTMGFNCRANPLLGELRDLLRSGRAGQPRYVRTVFATAPRELPAWKRQRDSGGGALLDLGAHHIDYVRYLTGSEVTGVRATIRSRVTDHDTALVELTLDSGVDVHMYFSLASAEAEHIEVHGDAARLAVSRFTSLAVDVIDNPGAGGGPVARVVRRMRGLRHVGRALGARRAPLREPGYALLLDAFITAVRTGAHDGYADLADGFACAAVIAAAEQSAISGRTETPASAPVSHASLQGTP